MIFSFSIIANAQSTTKDNYVFNNSALLRDVNFHSPAFYFDKSKVALKSKGHYRAMKTGGIVLTGVGGFFFVGGIVHIINSHSYPDDRPSSAERKNKMVVDGVLYSTAGALALGGGITMWAIAGNRLKKIKRGVTINFDGQSMGVAYKF